MNEMLNYEQFLNDAMLDVVKKSLTIVAKNGFYDDHHFFISFFTNYQKVKISKRLLALYPEEMSIVIQHQFDNFKVNNESFEISLTFSGIIEHLVIPFAALTFFADPSASFSLQFHSMNENDDNEIIEADNHCSSDEDSSTNTEKKTNKVISLTSIKAKYQQ